MKCAACKYDNDEVDGGDYRSFIKVEGGFKIETGDYYKRKSEEIALYACPKCGTIKLSDVYL